jgi:hypothetical protein
LFGSLNFIKAGLAGIYSFDIVNCLCMEKIDEVAMNTGE